MARNAEKAQSTLNRYLKHKQEEKTGPKQKRPYLASECRDLNEADKWRQQILREIGKKVMEIQNAGLGEHRWALFVIHKTWIWVGNARSVIEIHSHGMTWCLHGDHPDNHYMILCWNT